MSNLPEEPRVYAPFPKGERPKGWPAEYVALKDYKRLQQRVERLERIAKLAEELCESVDRQAEDIGGCRLPFTILRDLGPLVSV